MAEFPQPLDPVVVGDDVQVNVGNFHPIQNVSYGILTFDDDGVLHLVEGHDTGFLTSCPDRLCLMLGHSGLRACQPYLNPGHCSLAAADPGFAPAESPAREIFQSIFTVQGTIGDPANHAIYPARKALGPTHVLSYLGVTDSERDYY